MVVTKSKQDQHYFSIIIIVFRTSGTSYLLSLKRDNEQYDQLRSSFPNNLIFQNQEKDFKHCCVCPAGIEDFLPRFLCPGCNRSNATLFDRTSTTAEAKATTKALLTTALTSNYKKKNIEWSFSNDDEWIRQAFSTFHYVFDGIDDE